MDLIIKIQTQEEYDTSPELEELSLKEQSDEDEVDLDWDGCTKYPSKTSKRVHQYVLRGIKMNQLPFELFGCSPTTFCGIPYMNVVDAAGRQVKFFVKNIQAKMSGKVLPLDLKYSNREEEDEYV